MIYRKEYLLVILIYYLYDSIIAKRLCLVEILYAYISIISLVYSITIYYKNYITFL